jgi:hypothetical protein
MYAAFPDTSVIDEPVYDRDDPPVNTAENLTAPSTVA